MMSTLKKQPPANIYFGLAAIIVFCLCCVVGVSVIYNTDTPAASKPNPFISPTIDFQPPVENVRNSVIEYKVLGSGNASLTYENSTGNTEQLDTFLPWSYPRFYARTGKFLYVSAQIDGTGEITCVILINGTIYKKSTSKGQYVICTASTSAP